MALDDADKKTVTDLVTAALAAALKPEALAAAVAPVVKAHVGEATKGMLTEDAMTKAIAEAVAKFKPAESDDKGKKGKGGDEGESEAVAAMKKQMDELKAANEAERRARIDAERKAIVDGNRSKVRDALVKAGVPADRLHLAMPAIEASGALILDGDKPGWKGKDQYQVDTVLDFDAGAKAWTATADGKHFLPAVDARGTGDNGGARGGTQHVASKIRNADGSLNLQRLGEILPIV